MYNSQMGVWLQRDPAEVGNNLYDYCGAMPLTATDPSGLDWKQVGDWKKQWETGATSLIAECDCDTLAELAMRITGKEADARVLLQSVTNPDTQPATATSQPATSQASFTTQTILRAGTQVNVKPLLQVLDERLRDNIVNATTHFTGQFGEGWTGLDFENNKYVGTPSYVEKYFQENSQTRPVDCRGAALLVMTKGLNDTLTFIKRPFASPAAVKYMYDPKIANVAGLKKGDLAMFESDPSYYEKHPGGPWSAEWVITTEPGKTFWGFDLGPKTYDGWKEELVSAYNSNTKAKNNRQINTVPGYASDHTRSFNIGDLAAWLISLVRIAPTTKP